MFLSLATCCHHGLKLGGTCYEVEFGLFNKKPWRWVKLCLHL